MVQRAEFEHAMNPSERDRASYFHDRFVPISEAGQWQLVEGDAEIVPGISVVRIPGHNADIQAVKISGGGKHLLFVADMLPTRHHLPLAWMHGYDLYPMQTLETKRKWIAEIVKHGWIVAFGHDPEHPAATLHEHDGKIEFEPVDLATLIRSLGEKFEMAPQTIEKRGSAKSSRNAPRAAIGIIGGSGLYSMSGLSDTREVRMKTPFGEPSDAFVLGTLEGKRVAFLARHGRGHRILPGEINYRANIYAMKLLGVERIISVSAVGSLREDLRPGEFLVPDQFVDRTRLRVSTFFGGGFVAHVAFAHPTCAQVSRYLADACVHRAASRFTGSGTYVCMEGPQFSTLAEANMHRQLHFDVIGMTNATEAKLAREAEICYATIAMITDYDCWHPEHDSVTVTQIIATLNQNAENAQSVLREAVRPCPRIVAANAARRCSMRLSRI